MAGPGDHPRGPAHHNGASRPPPAARPPPGGSAMPLDDDAARLAKGQNLATVVTLMPDGRPQAQLTWIDHDGENILVNTEPQRQKSRNIRRDPRVTVLIHSATDTQDWAEVRGRVVETIDGARARAHIDEL